MKHEEPPQTQAIPTRGTHRRVCLFTALALWMLTLLPAAVQGQEFTYLTNNGTVTITGYAGPGGEVVIPATLDGLPVTGIGGAAFKGVTNITNVMIPDSVTNIGPGAFWYCTYLIHVTIGKGVTWIGREAFAYCPNLNAITVTAANPIYSSIDGVLFETAGTLVKYPEGKAGSYAIHEGVTNIAYRAFAHCPGLTSVTFADSVISIEATAFAVCVNLTNVTIGKGLNEIGGFAFAVCRSLATIAVDPSNLAYSSVDGVVFNKDQSTLVLCPEGRVGSYTIRDTVTTIGFSAFAGCASLTNITIPNSVTGMRSLAFYYCTSLGEMTIPNSVTNIASQAFQNCTNLTNVTIGNGVAGIEQRAFVHCTSLTNITIPNSVLSIGSGAFSECTNLTDIAIGNGASNIVTSAFRQCPRLAAITVDASNATYSSQAGVLFDKRQTALIKYPEGKAGSYTVPDSVTSIGSQAFTGCTSLTNVTIPNSVIDIGDYAFDYCPSVKVVTIGNGVTRIGQSAFAACTALTSVTVGSGVTSIGDYAFVSCSSLEAIYFQGNAPSVGLAVFDNSSVSWVYYLPGTTGWGPTFGERPTALWVLPNPVILTSAPSFGVQTNAFGFIISWATNVPVVVEACTDLASPNWSPLSTNTLIDGWSYFSDTQWANYLARFYRLRSP